MQEWALLRDGGTMREQWPSEGGDASNHLRAQGSTRAVPGRPRARRPQAQDPGGLLHHRGGREQDRFRTSGSGSNRRTSTSPPS